MQLVEVVEYAVLGLVIENIPISNTAPKKIVIAFNGYGRTLCYLIFATSYDKILNMMNVGALILPNRRFTAATAELRHDSAETRQY